MAYLKVILGCMFSSKTSTLLSEINRYKHITDKILVVNSILDKQRQSNKDQDSIIETHDKNYSCAVMVNQLSELKLNDEYKNKYDYSEIIIIDEGQFYNDLYDFIREELFIQNNKKMYIVAGLASDYNMEPIGDIIKLIPMADEIKKLYAYCIYCKDGTLASFTYKLTNDNNQILVGNKDIYSPCCRKHYLSLTYN
jgi:thymidine kinase